MSGYILVQKPVSCSSIGTIRAQELVVLLAKCRRIERFQMRSGPQRPKVDNTKRKIAHRGSCLPATA